MAKTIGTGYTDTAIGGFANNPQTLPAINWSVDHSPIVEVPGEVVTTNLSCPVDQPETFRFAQRKVANVYASTDVDPSAYLPVRQGTSTLVELREVWVETDSTDATYKKLIPVKCGITLTLPAYGGITADMALALARRALAGTFETGVATSTGFAALLRGVMKKKDL